VLRGIDPLLSGELLKVLDEMGHGDQLALVDRNYPAAASGRPVIRLGEVSVTRALSAILGVFPLDSFVPHPLERMEVDRDPARTTPAQDTVLEIARGFHSEPLAWGVVPRMSFYERARAAYAVVHTLDDQPWGCFLLQKGVVFSEDDSAAEAAPRPMT
jgi:L-fucose mutarotase